MDPRATACVTGATSGIGRAYAERFARDGFELLLTGRRAPELRKLAHELEQRCGVRVTAVIAELSREKDVAALVRRIQRLPRLEALVSNAGYGIGLPFHAVQVQDHLRMIAVHVTTALRLIHAALPGMIERRSGTIITVASMAAFLPLPNSAVYCGTKAFLRGMTESLAIETAADGIRVQCLCPGLVDTDFHRRRPAPKEHHPGSGVIPWMGPGKVVERSMRDLARGRVLCIPGFWNRVGYGAAWLMPRSLYARIVRRAAGRSDGSHGVTP